MTAAYWAGRWDGRRHTTWPATPPQTCWLCGAPGRLYLTGPCCDIHRPGGDPPPVYPITRPAAAQEYPLDHARLAWPGARRCSGGETGRACPYPLDPVLGDAIDHPACSPAGQRALAAARHADTLRGTVAARAAIAAKGAAA